MRPFIAFVLLLIALFLEVAIGDVFNVWLGFVLATLLTAAFFLNFMELVFLVFFAALVLNWQPALSLEILVFSAIPILVYFLKTFVPLQPFLASLFLISVSILFFYLIFSPSFFVARPRLLILDLSASLTYGSIVFWVLKILAQEPST